MPGWKHKAITFGMKTGALLELIFGALFGVLSGSAVLGNITRVANGSAERIFFAPAATVIFAVFALLFLDGLRRWRLLSSYRRLEQFVGESPYEELSALAVRLETSMPRLMGALSQMLKKGFFPGAYVDPERRVLVLKPTAYHPEELEEKPQGGLIKKRSVYPWVITAAVLAVCLLSIPVRGLGTVIGVLLFSAAVFLVTRQFAWDRYVKAPERQAEAPVRKEDSPGGEGPSELDELLRTAALSVKELVDINQQITSPSMNESISDTVVVCRQILDYVKKHPKKLPEIRQFLNYYLPTTVKLLKSYLELSGQAARGENIKTSIEKIEGMVAFIRGAFKKELDDLFLDNAMDISAEISVMRSMLESEGLDAGSGRA